VGKKEDTEEDKGSTMIYAIKLLRLVKGMPWDEVMSSSEEIRSVALFIIG